MFTAIIPILCNINPCMLFLLSIEEKKVTKYKSTYSPKIASRVPSTDSRQPTTATLKITLNDIDCYLYSVNN